MIRPTNQMAPLLTALSLTPVGRVSELHQPICPECEMVDTRTNGSRKGQRRNVLMQKGRCGETPFNVKLWEDPRITIACSQFLLLSCKLIGIILRCASKRETFKGTESCGSTWCKSGNVIQSPDQSGTLSDRKPSDAWRVRLSF